MYSVLRTPKLSMISEEVEVNEVCEDLNDMEISMQSMHSFKIIRNVMMRQMYERNRKTLEKNHAAVIIQGCFRRFMVQARMKRAVQNDAATDIQSYWRGYKGRKQFLSMKHSAILIQSYARMWQAQKAFKLGLMKRDDASIVIQKWVRRYLAVKKLQNLREENEAEVEQHIN